MFRNIRGCSQFPRMSHSDSLTYRWNLRSFKKFAKQIFSQNRHRVVEGVSNPSRILNLVSVTVRKCEKCETNL